MVDSSPPELPVLLEAQAVIDLSPSAQGAMLLDESVMPLVTEEMQEEFAAFAFLNGTGFQIVDSTYVQNP